MVFIITIKKGHSHLAVTYKLQQQLFCFERSESCGKTIFRVSGPNVGNLFDPKPFRALDCVESVASVGAKQALLV